MAVGDYLRQKHDDTGGFQWGVSAWLDRLSRLRYASANVANDIVSGNTEDIPDAIRRGLTGQEKGSYRGVAENLGLPSPFWYGLAGDIGLDPVTYVPVGGVAKAIGEPLARIPAVARAGKFIGESDAFQTVGKALNPNFRPKDIPVEHWQLLQKAKRLAVNIENMRTNEAYVFSKSIERRYNALLKSGQFDENTLVNLADELEGGANRFKLNAEGKRMASEIRSYLDDIKARRDALDKSNIEDYLTHSETEASKIERGVKPSSQYGTQEFTTTTKLDKERKIYKFENTDTGQSYVGYAHEQKLIPMSFKGMAEQDINQYLLSTVKDLADANTVAEQYGLKIRFTDKPSTSGNASGSFRPTTNTIHIATGGRTQEQIISTLSHEIAHHQHGVVGSLASLSEPMREAINTADNVANSMRVMIPKNYMRGLENTITNLSTSQKYGLYKIFAEKIAKKQHGLDPAEYLDWVNGKRQYFFQPTEVFARYAQIYKYDKDLAKQAFPKLYEIVENLGGISKPFKDFMDRALTTEGGLVRGARLFRKVTGRQGQKDTTVYIAKQATINEINKASKFRKSLPESVRTKISTLPEFSTDIPHLTYMSGKSQARAEAGNSFVESIKSNPQLFSTTKKEGLVAVSSPEFGGMYFEPAIAKEINKVKGAFVSDEATQGVLKQFDAVQNLWKAWSLGVFPAYHFRNAIGNLWNNFLGGVVSPKPYLKAGTIQNKLFRNIALTTEEARYIKLAKENSVIGKGIYSSELPTVEPKVLSLPDKLSTAPRKVMEKVGVPIEDNARLAHFIDKLDKGWSVEKASESVKKYLFDYGELTGFEKNVLKRIMPFYTWTRKNLPLQLEALVNQTGKVMAVEKTRSALARENNAPDEEVLPDWIARRNPMFVGRQGKEVSVFPLESSLPMADIYKLDRPKDVIGELLTPLLRTPIELSTNRSWYFDQPIEKYAGETESFLRKDLPVRFTYVARQVRILNELNNLIGKGKQSPEAPPQPTIPQRLVRLFTGVKTYKVDIEKAVVSKIYDLNKDMYALKIGFNKAKKYGRIAEQDRIEMETQKLQNEISRLETTYGITRKTTKSHSRRKTRRSFQ